MSDKRDREAFERLFCNDTTRVRNVGGYYAHYETSEKYKAWQAALRHERERHRAVVEAAKAVLADHDERMSLPHCKEIEGRENKLFVMGNLRAALDGGDDE